MIARERLKTPSEHGAVLIEPAPGEIVAALAAKRRDALDQLALLDTNAGELHRELLAQLNIHAPVVMTGHQAEFFHAGVFAKTIAADALAAAVRGTAVFLTVDSDVPKARHVPVPRVVDGRVRRELLDIPGCDPSVPLEAQPALPVERWCEFFRQVRHTYAHAASSLLPVYTGGWLACTAQRLDFCDAVVRGHAAVEHALGLGGSRDLRVSQLSQTRALRCFAAHLLLNAEGFAECYNAAQQAYRRRNRVRNDQRPVPPLMVEAERTESPLWVWRDGQPRRRLFVRRVADEIVFLADEEPIGREPLSRLRCAECQGQPWGVERDGWRVRPRALSLSSFARLLLADVFIHGVGGAKYDEMTEDFVRAFFGVEPAAMCCVTATLHLPLPRRGGDLSRAAARHALHDLPYNPQRHVSSLPAEMLARRAALFDESRRLRAEAPRERARRRRVYQEIREVNAALRAAAGGEYAAVEERLRSAERDTRDDALAQDREYFFALHDSAAMGALAAGIQGAFGAGQG
ncbi:MAG: hypothetical protein HRF50_11940 [Phycisphaerae bacterium]|jgi:hypothetical protein